MAFSKKLVKEAREKVNNRMRDRGESWTPRYRRLFGVPSILPQEAVSSWLCRVAVKMKIPMDKLQELWGLELPIFWLDVAVEALKLDDIARMSMKSADSFVSQEWGCSPYWGIRGLLA